MVSSNKENPCSTSSQELHRITEYQVRKGLKDHLVQPLHLSDTYVVRAAAATAASIAILTGCPLCRGGIWILSLACHSSNGTEHLGSHVLW